jgi:hypothetical protein
MSTNDTKLVTTTEESEVPIISEVSNDQPEMPPLLAKQSLKKSWLLGFREQSRELGSMYARRRMVSLSLTVFFLLLMLAAVPYSRYAVIGLFVKQDITITVIDSKSAALISKVTVSIGNQNASTNAQGIARIHTNVGYQTMTISKHYYQTYTHSQLVAVSASRNHTTIKLVALGRLVPVSITNKLTGKAIAGVTIKALNSEAVTGSDGAATIILPVTVTTQTATIMASGYNTLNQNLVVTDQVVSANTFAITPIGKLYFLSNLSGKIDVIKTDLDGMNRQIVLAGTGKEDQYSTVLLASRDWKYLALYAQRTAKGNPEIDLIDTSTDTMSNIDEGNAAFTLVGWDGDKFVYQVNRSSISAWQNGQQVLKSFDAPTKDLTILDQTTASGSSQYDYLGQSFGTAYILDGKVVYPVDWSQGSYGSSILSTKQATLNTVNPDGSGKLVIKGFNLPSDAGPTYNLSINVAPYDSANSIAITTPTNGQPIFYEYKNGSITTATDITSQSFYSNNYPTYLLSPSGNKTFWSVYADGKNNLRVGDKNSQGEQVVASQSDYSPYGWFTDGYLLLEKSGSELYITSSDGTSQPFKITNYYKPQVSYRGYGGGYGGL